MSLRINTNVQAMTALRNLSQTVDHIGMSITRLSTGLRINNAADDPAGLIISEGMRSQLKGLDQAIRNSQDAVNMAKTAEGAMEEVQSLLKSMRGLAVSSANAAVADSNVLQANQAQVRSIIQSIDRIANQTSWGKKKLLDGTAGISTAVTNATLVQNMYFGSSINGDTVTSGNVTISQTTAATAAAVTAGRTFATVNTTIATTGTFVINGFTFTSDGTDTVQSMINKINAMSPQTNVVATAVTVGANQSIRLTNMTPGANHSVNLTDPNNIIHNAANATSTGVNGVYDITVPTLTGSQTVTFTGGRSPGDSGLKLTDTEGNVVTLTAGGNQNWPGGTPTIGSITSGAVQFQIGANPNQSVMFAMPKVYASDLGTGVLPGKSVASMDLTTTAGANEAMQIIDNAIDQLSSLRGNIGSFQANFLESTVRSLGVARENMTAAESQIRDADMAEEMTRYTQLQILQQSGMAMLAQANQQPNSIMSLLRGQ